MCSIRALAVGDLVRLYGRRWHSELALLLLKEQLELHLWWQSKVTGILQQIWACLIIAQLVQAMRMEIACQAHVDPFEVSMPLVIRSMPTLLASGQDPIAVCAAGQATGLDSAFQSPAAAGASHRGD